MHAMAGAVHPRCAAAASTSTRCSSGAGEAYSLRLGSSSGLRQRCLLQQQQHQQRRRLDGHAGLGGSGSGSRAASGQRRGGRLAIAAVSEPQPQRREMSLNQRWRALKFALKERGAQLRELPPVAAVRAAVAALNARLTPLYALLAALQAKQAEVYEMYNQFLAEETKRQWTWSKIFRKEMEWWSAVPPFIGYFLCTVIYQAFIPVSFLAALVLPLGYAWVVWDEWYRSPVFLATALMATLKFPPWALMSPIFCWVWPGLI